MFIRNIFAPVVAWWVSARPGSTVWMIVLVVVAAAARTFAVVIGVDRLTTIDTGDAPLTYWLSTIVAVIVATCAARSWFGPPLEQQARMPLYHLRRDRPGAWWIVGAAFGAVLAIASAWVAYGTMGVIAQYIPGRRVAIDTTVLSARVVSTPKTVCRYRMVLRDDRTGTTIPICLRTLFRSTLGPSNLNVGTQVTVYVDQTVLGRVVVMVTAR